MKIVILSSDDYDDESINASEFDEDSISLSWAASFNSSMDIDDRINQSSTDFFSESEEDDDEAVDPRPGCWVHNVGVTPFQCKKRCLL